MSVNEAAIVSTLDIPGEPSAAPIAFLHRGLLIKYLQTNSSQAKPAPSLSGRQDILVLGGTYPNQIAQGVFLILNRLIQARRLGQQTTSYQSVGEFGVMRSAAKTLVQVPEFEPFSCHSFFLRLSA